MSRRFLPLVLVVVGCMEGQKSDPLPRVADKASPPRVAELASGDTLYQRLGGAAGIRKIVDDFCANVLASESYREVHKKHFREGDVAGLKQKLRDQFGEEAGGPEKYAGKNMKDAHKGLGITEADFAALVAALVKALDQNNIAEDDKNAFLTKLARYKDDVIEKPAPENR